MLKKRKYVLNLLCFAWFCFALLTGFAGRWHWLLGCTGCLGDAVGSASFFLALCVHQTVVVTVGQRCVVLLSFPTPLASSLLFEGVGQYVTSKAVSNMPNFKLN